MQQKVIISESRVKLLFCGITLNYTSFFTDLWTFVLHVYNYWMVDDSFLTVLPVCTLRLTSARKKNEKLNVRYFICVWAQMEKNVQVQAIFWYFTNSKNMLNMHTQRVFKFILLKCAPTSADTITMKDETASHLCSTCLPSTENRASWVQEEHLILCH